MPDSSMTELGYEITEYSAYSTSINSEPDASCHKLRDGSDSWRWNHSTEGYPAILSAALIASAARIALTIER